MKRDIPPIKYLSISAPVTQSLRLFLLKPSKKGLGSDFHLSVCISAHTVPDSLNTTAKATLFVIVFAIQILPLKYITNSRACQEFLFKNFHSLH